MIYLSALLLLVAIAFTLGFINSVASAIVTKRGIDNGWIILIAASAWTGFFLTLYL